MAKYHSTSNNDRSRSMNAKDSWGMASAANHEKQVTMSHRDGDPDKTKEEYDQDNHADQENPNNDEYDK
jgi:hypothetical protein